MKIRCRSFISRVTSLLLVLFLLLAFLPGRQSAATEVKADAQKFIDQFTAEWLKLRYAYSQASWNSNIRIVEGDETNSKAENAALEKLTTFTGSRENIAQATAFLKLRDKLAPLQTKQLERIL